MSKYFYVSWEEKHSTLVKAENKEEAIEKIKNGEHDTEIEDAIFQGNVEAWENEKINS